MKIFTYNHTMKDALLKHQSDILDALAHPVRLKIVEKLRSGPCCVCKIFAYVGAEQSNVSHHLAILKRAGVVRSVRKGTWIWYEIGDTKIFKIVDLVTSCVAGNLTRSRKTLQVLLKERN